MLVDVDQFEKIYGFIKEDASKGGCSVLIMVAANCDSLCAAQIFTRILKADLISYEIKYVAGYEDFETVHDSHIKDSTEIRTIILFNCGGIVDLLGEYFGLAPTQTVYIIDSHRPYHKANVAGKQVWLIGKDSPMLTQKYEAIKEGEIEFPDFQVDPDDLLSSDDLDEEVVEESDDDYDDDDDEDDDDDDLVDDNGDGDGKGGSKRRKVGEDGSYEGEDDEERARLEAARERRKERRRREKREAMMHKRDRRRTKKRLRAYHLAVRYMLRTTFAASASTVISCLASSLNKTNNDILWLGILGLTDQLVHGRITDADYEALAEEFGREVIRLNVDDNSENATEGTTQRFSGDSTVTIVPNEMHFLMYRHWTLYDSMYNSPRVATPMAVWKEKGRARLLTLLAKMTVPLHSSKLPYPTMTLELKETLRTQITKWAPTFELPNICYTGFLKHKGFGDPVSAIDVVHSITALMETGDSDADGGRKGSEEKDDDENENDNGAIARGHRDRHQSAAYLALRSKDVSWLGKGVGRAIEVQLAIVEQCKAMLDKRAVVRIGKFRYALIQESRHLHLLKRPMALTRLAQYLMAMMEANTRGQKKPQRPKPIVIGALDADTGRYLVVGVQPRPRQHNWLGQKFLEAAERTHSTLYRASFDHSMVSLKKEDITRFVEFLHAGL
eukprot:TRINITY_DN5101_c0_g1_i1.p1 TRINITY_DN5101_c0_g1~~TRINITY_DN5101_c0_g1_i1.p1  ORF type:complete len:672 (+),score=152.14 TRINITY_DN5101_c0_g1_i1:62-2077(+)